MQEIIKGSVERFTLTMPQINDSTLQNSEWRIIIHSRKDLIIEKSEAIHIDDDTYDFIVDTSLISIGDMSIILEIEIKDSNMDTGYRKQIIRHNNTYRIVSI